MPLEIILINKFKKDLKKIKKQNKDLKLLGKIIDILANQETIPHYYKNHKLINNYVGYFELHIQPDWLLIYKIENNILYLARIGSHSELF